MAGVEIKLLGTGAGPGVPAFFCECAACREARTNPSAARTRSTALLTMDDKGVLIDASPDLRVQLCREGIQDIHTVFLTHWHHDHFAGLGELEYYLRLKDKGRRLPIYLPPGYTGEFTSTFCRLIDVVDLREWEYGRRYDFGMTSVILLRANHGIETGGVLIEAGKKLAYFPDTSWLPEETLLSLQGIDYLVCDATFYGENWYPDTHMSVAEAIELGKRVGAGQTILTHLSMHYSSPVTVEELNRELAGLDGVLASYDGLKVELY
ncbi:MBL fold metallo-hydrolase [Thermanaeromonas sp. C210]|uniref:MBL fold metallo-hydrolase n=1 Tax=Thermanaeromonas sp. C210 TaxID=2731925 RepID=UPI00155D1292|nr:MBL fold metallo-hydrolase [Thermanaeromonas sp. C210]GFN23491.1 MBL fold metallo-hydrolase [Thermanaeromonas sp. C210]